MNSPVGKNITACRRPYLMDSTAPLIFRVSLEGWCQGKREEEAGRIEGKRTS